MGASANHPQSFSAVTDARRKSNISVFMPASFGRIDCRFGSSNADRCGEALGVGTCRELQPRWRSWPRGMRWKKGAVAGDQFNLSGADQTQKGSVACPAEARINAASSPLGELARQSAAAGGDELVNQGHSELRDLD